MVEARVVNKRFQLVERMVLYLSNNYTSETAVGGPLKFGDPFPFGGTDGAPERSRRLTIATVACPVTSRARERLTAL